MKRLISFKLLFFSMLLVILSCSSIFAYANNDSSKKTCINVVPESHNISPNIEFITNVTLESVNEAVYSGVYSNTYYHGYINTAKNIYAEDIQLSYDVNYFEFIKAEIPQTQGGLQILHQEISKEGQLRFIIASKGEYYGINNDTQILKLTFRSKNMIGLGKIVTTHGLIANGEGVEFETNCSESTVQVGAFNADVNHDGRYSLGDLAIDSRHYGMCCYAWNPRFDVDVIKDNQINDFDLKAIVETIVFNEK